MSRLERRGQLKARERRRLCQVVPSVAADRAISICQLSNILENRSLWLLKPLFVYQMITKGYYESTHRYLNDVEVVWNLL